MLFRDHPDCPPAKHAIRIRCHACKTSFSWKGRWDAGRSCGHNTATLPCSAGPDLIVGNAPRSPGLFFARPRMLVISLDGLCNPLARPQTEPNRDHCGCHRRRALRQLGSGRLVRSDRCDSNLGGDRRLCGPLENEINELRDAVRKVATRTGDGASSGVPR